MSASEEFSATPNEEISISRIDFGLDHPLDEKRKHKIPKPLPNQAFVMCICGQPRSGKTTLMFNMISKRGKMYNKIFDWVFMVSTTFDSIPADHPVSSLPDTHVWEELDASTVDQIQCVLDLLPKHDSKLLILDDCMAEFKDRNVVKAFKRWVANRRHFNLSIMAITQVYNEIDLKVRKMFSHLMIFPITNPKELNSIAEEMAMIDEKVFRRLANWVFGQGKHSFMFIDKDGRRIYRQFDEITGI